MKSKPTSRRNFFHQLAGWTTAAASAVTLRKDPLGEAALAAVRNLSETTPDQDEEFWRFIRKQHILEEGLIYLNNGTTGAMPRPVFEAVVRYQRMLAENPKIRATFEHVVHNEVRRKAAEFIGAGLEETALTRNTTEGLNIVAHGLPLKAGDEVLLTDQEHPAAIEPWRIRAKRDGILVKAVAIPSPLPDAKTFLNLFEKAITQRTKVIAIPHITTTTGLITPAREICRLARERGLLTLLDGAHCIGQFKLNVKELGCDFYACSPHKWLHAPLGNGVFYVKRAHQERLWPLNGHAGWDKFPDARKYTAFGNRDWAGAVALGDAIDFANAIGMEKIERRGRALMTYLRKHLANFQELEALTPSDPQFYCAQSAFGIKNGVPADRFVKYLRERHKVIVAPKGHGVNGIRIDTSYYVTWQELDKTIEIFRHTLKKGLET
jgi:selenocysteine lyase/cysteine desulfurase